jgi:hypothetical protein
MRVLGTLGGAHGSDRNVAVKASAARPEDIDKLVEKIILPSDLQDPFNDGIHALTDRVAITYAPPSCSHSAHEKFSFNLS